MSYLITISVDIRQLKGKGEEWLLSSDGEFVIAKFFNGSFINNNIININTQENTKEAA